MEQITKEQEKEFLKTRNTGICKKVKSERLKKGYSQHDLAWYINSSQSVINNIENNITYNAKMGTLLKISKVLGVPL